MDYVVDTNVLLRSLDAEHPDHAVALEAIRHLATQRHRLLVVPQVLYEWWVVATRPLAANGLGMQPPAALLALAEIEAAFPVRHDGPRLLSTWRMLVQQHLVVGKAAHDARIAAAMQVHGLGHLLTFNGADFARYPFLTVLSPAEVTTAA